MTQRSITTRMQEPDAHVPRISQYGQAHAHPSQPKAQLKRGGGVASRLVHLDALRAVACLMVVYRHITTVSIESLGINSGAEYWVWCLFAKWLDTGKIGVVLFFALSGYIIPVSMPARDRPIVRFLISRFFRLYPAYWLSLGMAFVLLTQMQHLVLSDSTWIANVTMAQHALGKDDVLMVYWTLFIELVFYALCIFHFLNSRKLFVARYCFAWSSAFLILALACAAARFETQRRLPIALFLALSVMHWSSVWRAALHGDAPARRMSRIYLALFAVTMPVIAMLGYNVDMGFQETWYRYTLSYFSGITLFVVFTRYPVVKAQWLVWTGTISYSIYLLHTLIVAAADRLGILRFAFHSPHIYFCELLVIILFASWLSYHLVELPGQRLGSILRGSLRGGAAKSPGPPGSNALPASAASVRLSPE